MSVIRHRCASQFSGIGSTRAGDLRSPQRSEDGSKSKAKSIKRNVGGGSGAGVDWEFWGYAFSHPLFVTVTFIAILNTCLLILNIVQLFR